MATFAPSKAAGARAAPARRCASSRVSAVRRVRAAAAGGPPGDAQKLAQAAGLEGLEEGIFGFKPLPEVFVGRLAMLGFATGVTVELTTGVPILRQLSLETPNPALFATLCGLMGLAVAFGTARTLVRLQSGDMDVATFRRYASFFGLSAEEVAKADAERRKRSGAEFTSADNLAAIEEAKQALASDGSAAAPPAAAAANSPAAAVAAGDAVPIDLPDLEKAFARNVELNNGRAAMLGFAVAIVVEAASGVGVIGQLESYAKLLGVLGPASGF